jgi:hypothetical protein
MKEHKHKHSGLGFKRVCTEQSGVHILQESIESSIWVCNRRGFSFYNPDYNDDDDDSDREICGEAIVGA